LIKPQTTTKILPKLTNDTIIDTTEAQQRTEPHKDNKNYQEHLFGEKETSRSTFSTQVQPRGNPSATQAQLSGKTDQRKKDSTIEKTKLSIPN